MPASLGYGGAYFNVSLPSTAFASSSDVGKTTFVVSRTGFSTHAMNSESLLPSFTPSTAADFDFLSSFSLVGMRHLQLDSTYTQAEDGSATFHVSQIPPNAAIFPPGPALFFCVVNGVPSQATWIMVGSGKIETQKTNTPAALPENFVAVTPTTAATTSAAQETGGSSTSPGSAGGSTQSRAARKVGGGWVASSIVALGGATLALLVL